MFDRAPVMSATEGDGAGREQSNKMNAPQRKTRQTNEDTGNNASTASGSEDRLTSYSQSSDPGDCTTSVQCSSLERLGLYGINFHDGELESMLVVVCVCRFSIGSSYSRLRVQNSSCRSVRADKRRLSAYHCPPRRMLITRA